MSSKREEPKKRAADAVSPATPTGLPELGWLHISDSHFKAGETWDRRATLTALMRHLAERKAEGFAPRFVFWTGDVAYSGKWEEYEQALRFTDELAQVLELDPREAFFLVPGNHDVDRSKVKGHESKMLASLRDPRAIEDLLRDEASLAPLGRRLESFYAFTERLLGASRAFLPAQPWRVDLRELGARRVAILQLNSAWASGSNDEKHLLVGQAQVYQALADSADAFLRIALVHHPVEDLIDADRASLEGLLDGPEGAAFVLRGHLHRNKVEQRTTPDSTSVLLAAGCLYEDGSYPRRFLTGQLDFGAGSAEVGFFSVQTGDIGNRTDRGHG